MKIPKHVEDTYKCNECGKMISTKSVWYRIRFVAHEDFCSKECGLKYRDRVYEVYMYDDTFSRRVMGNTD